MTDTISHTEKSLPFFSGLLTKTEKWAHTDS